MRDEHFWAVKKNALIHILDVDQGRAKPKRVVLLSGERLVRVTVQYHGNKKAERKTSKVAE